MIPQSECDSNSKKIAIKRAGHSWKPMSIKPRRKSASGSSGSEHRAKPKDRSHQELHPKTRLVPLPIAHANHDIDLFSQPQVERNERGHPTTQFTEAPCIFPSFTDLWLRDPRAFIVAAQDPRLSRRYCSELVSEICPPPVTWSDLYAASITISQSITRPFRSPHPPRDFLLEVFQQNVERTIAATRFAPVLLNATATSPHSGISTELVPETRDHQGIHLNALDSSFQNDQREFGRINSSHTIPSLGLTLACPEDRGMLNDHLIFLRHQIEYFPATEDDVMSHTRGRNKSIAPGQVGVRCRHCSRLPAGQRRKGSTYFPSTLMGVYQAAQNINIEHLQSGLCPKMPKEIKAALIRTRETKTAASGIGKAYWAESARRRGLTDTEDGIRFTTDTAARPRSLLSSTNLPHGCQTQFSTRNW